MISNRIRLVLKLFTIMVCIFSVAPVVVIVLESFTATDFVVFPPQGLSLKWYAEFLKRPEFVNSALISLGVATAACIAATCLGTLISIVLNRYKSPASTALQALFMAPLTLPGIILGLGLLQFFAWYGLPRNTLGMILAHVVITTPFAIRFVSVALLGVRPEVEQAAESLGAGKWQVFYLITLPLIRPGVIASLVFAFILSFDEVAASLFMASPTATTLPVRIFSYIEQNYDPLVTSVSSLMVFVAVFALAIIERHIGIGRLFGIQSEIR